MSQSSIRSWHSRALTVALAAALLPALPVQASTPIDSVVMFRNGLWEQTSESAPGAEVAAFITLGAVAASDFIGAFDAGVVFIPPSGTSVELLLESDPAEFRNFNHASGLFSSVAEMNLAYGSGTYSFMLTGLAPAAIATMEYLVDDYPTPAPHLVGGSFTAAQGFDAAADFSFLLSPFSAPSSDSFIFLRVYEAGGGGPVVAADFLPPETTSWTLAAGLLHPGQDYRLEMIYSGRTVQDASLAGTNFNNLLAFDARTSLAFSTSPIPEPGPGALLLAGLLALGAIVRRRAA